VLGLNKNEVKIQAFKKKVRYTCNTLTQGVVGFSDHCLLGLNKNAGEEILLRLRTSDTGSFRPYLSIRETLVFII